MSSKPPTRHTPGPAGALERARSITEFLEASAPRIEAARALPPDVTARLNEARMFRLLLPRSLGGDELHLVEHARVMETIAAADASVAWCMGQGAGCAMSAAYLRPDVARRFFGQPDAVLAWGAGIQGKATEVDGGFRVTGKWTFASGAANATLLGAHSFVLDRRGQPVLRPDGRQLDRSLLFAKSKATIHDMWHTLGLKGTASYTYEVQDLFVPFEESIERENPSERVEEGTLYLFPATLAYAVGFSALMLGIAAAMVKDLRHLALGGKTPRALPSSLRDSPVFQSELAQLEARVRACRAYLHGTVGDVWAEVDITRDFPLSRKADLKLATTWVINQGVQIVHDAYRLAGNNAIFPTEPFEHRLRDAMTASQQTQGRPANYVTIGRVLMGLEPDTTMFLQ